MVKFKTLNRFLVRIGLKRKSNQDLKRTSFWSTIWRRKSHTESTRSPNNGATPSRGNSGIVKALSSFFKKKSEPTHVQQSCESFSDGSVESNILVEPSIDHQLDQYSINEIITEDELSESDTVNYDSLSSLESEPVIVDPFSVCYEEEHEAYCSDYWSSQPQDWESSDEWAIFNVPEEPDPQIQLKRPKKKVSWEDDDEHVMVDVEGLERPGVKGLDKERVDGEGVEIEELDEEEVDEAAGCFVEIERPRLDDEKPKEQELWQWTTAVFIVFLLLLFT